MTILTSELTYSCASKRKGSPVIYLLFNALPKLYICIIPVWSEEKLLQLVFKVKKQFYVTEFYFDS